MNLSVVRICRKTGLIEVLTNSRYKFLSILLLVKYNTWNKKRTGLETGEGWWEQNPAWLHAYGGICGESRMRLRTSTRRTAVGVLLQGPKRERIRWLVSFVGYWTLSLLMRPSRLTKLRHGNGVSLGKGGCLDDQASKQLSIRVPKQSRKRVDPP